MGWGSAILSAAAPGGSCSAWHVNHGALARILISKLFFVLLRLMYTNRSRALPAYFISSAVKMLEGRDLFLEMLATQGSSPTPCPPEILTSEINLNPGVFRLCNNPGVTQGACEKCRPPRLQPPGVLPQWLWAGDLEPGFSPAGSEAGVPQPAVLTLLVQLPGSWAWLVEINVLVIGCWDAPRPRIPGHQGTLTRTLACLPAPKTCRFHGSRTDCGNLGSH